MKQNGRKMIVIGGGIAGLCTAVYAQRCGYQTELLEMHDSTGGLATSWQRGDYTFETCLHWLLGSKRGGELHGQWQEVCDIDKLTFVDPVEFVRIETEHGASLSIWTDVDRLERELLQHAPGDAAAIRKFASAIRRLRKCRLPDPAGGLAGWLTLLHNVSCLPLLRRLSGISSGDYGRQFSNPLLKSFFGDGDAARLSAIAPIFSLAWMNAGNAGYAIGGSQALIRLIQQKLQALGGIVRCGARVKGILVEDDTAVGVQLAGGETLVADWVVSAADGHATIYELLGGRYTDKATNRMYETMETFPSYLQVSLGVNRDLSQQPPLASRLLDQPLRVDPETETGVVSFRFFHFDPTFAPPGKTAVTCVLHTRDFEYWTDLHQRDPQRYRAEKQRLADAVIAILERKIPGIRQAIEVVDVSTPATVIRCTGNWKGSMEGWFLVPGLKFRPMRNTLPGLRRFMMVGQWVMPGGGLPSGLMTARPAVQAICRRDGVAFLPAAEAHPKEVRHWRARTP